MGLFLFSYIVGFDLAAGIGWVPIPHLACFFYSFVVFFHESSLYDVIAASASSSSFHLYSSTLPTWFPVFSSFIVIPSSGIMCVKNYLVFLRCRDYIFE